MSIIKLRRATASQWASSNPILNDGEMGIETGQNPVKIKIGDGSTTWNALNYIVPTSIASSGSIATAVSFNPIGTLSSTNVQAALAELDAESNSRLLNSQPLDTNLTSIASLSTTFYGRDLLTSTNSAALYTKLGTEISSRFATISAQWLPSTVYVTGQLVHNAGILYRVTTNFTSSPTSFTTTNLSSIPGAGGGSGDMLAANNLSDVVSASAARTNLGLGTAATTSSGAYDAAGAAAAAQAASQPLDSDLTAIAALSTTAFGRSLLIAANSAALYTNLGTEISSRFAPVSQLWQPSTAYKNGQLVHNAGTLYRVTVDFTSPGSFNTTNLSVITGGGGGSGDMLAANNLSDLASVSTARTNLGLGTAATQATSAFDAAGAASAAQSASQPVDSDLTAIAALTTTTYGRSLLTQADAAATRSILGLGTASTQAIAAFDAAGAAATAQSASQPLDSGLTAISALTTTTFGRSLLTQASASAARTTLALGTAATTPATDYEVAGAAAAAQAASQPLDSDLTSIASLATTSYGRGLLTQSNAAALYTQLGTEISTRFSPISALWQASTVYKAGQLVHNGGTLYRVTADFTSPGSFTTTNLTSISGGGGSTATAILASSYATLDGTTNAYSGITSAMSAALSAKQELIIDGMAAVGTSVSIPSGLTVRGANPATCGFKALTSGMDLITMNSADSHLIDVTLDNNALATYSVAINGARCLVRGCIVKNSTGYGVHVYGGGDTLITENWFLQIDSYGVLAETSGGRITITDNHFYHTTATKGQGVTVKDGPTEIIITGNFCSVKGTVGLEVQSSTAGYCTISNNVTRNCDIGISFSSTDNFAAVGNECYNHNTYGIEAAQGATNGAIVGNLIRNCNYGIVATGSSSRNVGIKSNTIYTPTTSGIQVQNGSGHNVIDNQIDNPGDRAILFDTSDNGKISGNFIRRTVAATGSNADGMYVNGSDITISDNTINYVGLVTPNGAGIYVNGTRTAIMNNRFDGNMTMGVYMSGGDYYTFDGNITDGVTSWTLCAGTTIANAIVLSHLHNSGTATFNLTSVTNLRMGMVYYSSLIRWASPLVIENQTTGTTSPSAGGAGSLPATPLGYLTVKINGTDRKMPYY